MSAKSKGEQAELSANLEATKAGKRRAATPEVEIDLDKWASEKRAYVPLCDEDMNLYQRLAMARREVQAYLRKDIRVSVGEGGTYPAVSHDMVTAAVRPALVRYGVWVSPRTVGHHTEPTGNQTRGKHPRAIVRYTIDLEVDFINADDPQDRMTIPVSAHAEDSGDKAPGKAFSYAIKYLYLKMFLLETGEAEEGRIESEVERISDIEYRSLYAMCEEAIEQAQGGIKVTAEEMLEAVASSYFMIRSGDIRQLPSQMFAEAKDMLARKIEQRLKQIERQRQKEAEKADK